MNKNEFCPTPPMGWNSYDYYDTTVTEDDVKRNADYMAEHLSSYGWEYVVVDIQWYAHGAGTRRAEYQYIPFSKMEMDEYSRFLPDPERFPSSADGSGFKKLADYVHSKGLKFGIHIMRGIPRLAAHLHGAVLGTDITADEIADPSSISKWNPDMYGVRNSEAGQLYYDSLLALYASWGVDFIKCDDICNTNMYPHDPYSARHEVEMLHRAIEKTGRPIVLSLSPGPALIEEAAHYEENANMWRITDDFWDRWDLLRNMFDRCRIWQDHVSAGCFPDCDMLPIGMLGKGFGEIRSTNFTFEEQKTMLSLWCLFGSPLMIGSELPSMDEKTLSLLTNEKILKMRDPKYVPHLLFQNGEEAVWEAHDQAGTAYFVTLFNLSDEKKKIRYSGENSQSAEGFRPVSLEEMWTGKTYSSWQEISETEIPPHGCLSFTLTMPDPSACISSGKALVDKLSSTRDLTDEELTDLLLTPEKEVEEYLFSKAREVREAHYGKKVYLRGLVEFTNYCRNNCFYCGIRKGNAHAQRYRLTEEEILSCCDEGYKLGFRTFVLQGGEDPYFTDEIMVSLIRRIKAAHPDCALTLSIGEKEKESYRKFFDAGADRYLLRHETADPEHYATLHPKDMSFDHRMQCLTDLHDIGYQVGCGMMIGSPGQKIFHLIRDLRFLQKFQPEMVGTGPFIPHKDTIYAKENAGTAQMTLRILSVIRLMLPEVLLPSTTALGTIDPMGREKGILAGANVVMPNLSPTNVRSKYLLYDNKICTGDEAAECIRCMSGRVSRVGYEVVTDRGDHKRFRKDFAEKKES